METGSHDSLITIVAAISAGVLLVAMARRIAAPAIVLLLLGGFALGPEGLGIVKPASLGDGLSVIVAVSVALILFEGGLTLDLDGYRTASGVIKRLLSVGVLVTWIATAAAIALLFGFPLSYAVLGASLVIVTGPTVIGPLLKRIRVTQRLHSILHWEGVLIDPIGVFIAILCFEWFETREGATALGNFALRFAAGAGIGVAGGLVARLVFRLRVAPKDMANVVALAFAVLTFGITEAVIPDGGVLAVTVAGFTMAFRAPPEIKKLRAFKAELTDLLIGMLFMLLAARLRLAQFEDFGMLGAALVGVVMFVVRPLNVLVSAWGSDLSWREKLFLSWVAPRGIVAASMASLFTLTLAERGDVPNPRFLETFTYSVIVATVLLQGLTAGPLAWLLGLRPPPRRGFLIVGAHPFARALAGFLVRRAEVEVVLVDTNARAVAEAQADGLTAIVADARDTELEERDELQPVGNLLALTDNEDLNVVICQFWKESLGREHVWRWGRVPAAGAARGAAGQLVFHELPKPSVVSAELVTGDAQLDEYDTEPTSDEALPGLVCLRRGRVLLDPGYPIGDSTDAGPSLHLRRPGRPLSQSLRPELVLRIDTPVLRGVMTALADAVSRALPEVERESLLRTLLDRRVSFPSELGNGVAVLHSYSTAVTRRLVALAQVPCGISFDVPGEQPVQLVFLVLAPPGDPEGHLALVAEIAFLVADPAVRARLLSAEEPEQVLDAIRNAHVPV